MLHKRSHTLHNKIQEQAQLGMPNSRIPVELGFILQAGICQILNFAQNPRQSQSVQGTELNWLAENLRWSPSVAIWYLNSQYP